MPLPISRSQADKLGQRLALPGPHSDEDMRQFQQVLIAYAGVVTEARQILDVLESSEFRNVSITGRAKTTQTTLEKLARNKSRLSSIEDLAGVRIVADMTFTEQDALAGRVCDLFEEIADTFGRSIRYGEPPDPVFGDERFAEAKDFVARAILISDLNHSGERELDEHPNEATARKHQTFLAGMAILTTMMGDFRTLLRLRRGT